MVAPWHAQIAEDKLREEGEVKADKYNECGNPGPDFRIGSSGHFGPPEVNAPQITHDRAADHDVMEVSDHEISVVNVDVDAKGRKKQTG